MTQAGELLSQLGVSGGERLPVELPLFLALLVPLCSQLVPQSSAARVDAWLSRRSPWMLAVGAALALVVIDTLGPEGVAAFLYYQF